MTPCPRCGAPVEPPQPCAACPEGSGSADATMLRPPGSSGAEDRPTPRVTPLIPPANPDATPFFASGDAGTAKVASPRGGPRARPRKSGDMFGRYVLDAVLGRGGMGIVWKAWDPVLARRVALKQMLPDLIDQEAAQRFLREGRAAARLRHAGIVAVHDVGEVEGAPYLAMEYVEGTTFAGFLAESLDAKCSVGASADRLRAEVEILAQVAEAVGHAHRQGILHRDLKPGNILLDDRGKAFVTDFGLAKALGESDPPAGGPASLVTLSGQILGTPAYMSPEQANGNVTTLSPRTDVYALGAILNEVLTGQVPFGKATPWELLNAVMMREPDPPSRVAPGVPLELEAVCMKALEKNPVLRYADAGQLAGDLRRWLAGEPVQARRVGWAGRLARRWRRRRGVLALAAGVLVGLGAIGVWGRLESRARGQRTSRLIAQVAESVLRLQAEVGRAHTELQTLIDLAEQPLGLLDSVIAEDDRHAAALAWRGKLRILLGETRRGREDLDRAIAIDPEWEFPLWLRGASSLQSYVARRGLPEAIPGPAGPEFRPRRPVDPEEAALLESARADLSAAESAPRRDPAVGDAERMTARAMLAFCAETAEGYAEAAAQLDGVADGVARRLRGLSLFRLGRHEEAAAALDLSLTNAAYDGQARMYRGMVRIALGAAAEARGQDGGAHYTGALEDLDVALALDPTHVPGHARRAVARSGLGSSRRDRGNDAADLFRSAIDDWDRVLAATPHDLSARAARMRTRMFLAESITDRGGDPRAEYAAVAAETGALLQQRPDFTDLRVLRGQAEFQTAETRRARGEDPGDGWERALAEFDAALRTDGSSGEAWAGRGAALIRIAEAESARGADPEARLTGAIAAFDRAIELFPRSAEHRIDRGIAHRARADLETARGRDATDLLTTAIADFTGAMEIGMPALRALEARASAYEARARIAAGAGGDPREDRKSALADRDAQVSRGNVRWETLAQRGSLLVRLGQDEAPRGVDPRPLFRRAAEDFAAAAAAHPSHPVLRNAGGNARLNLGDATQAWGEDPGPAYAAAESEYRAALEGGYTAAWLNLGLLFRSQGRWDDAARAFDSAAADPARARTIEARRAELRNLAAADVGPWATPWRHADLSLQFGRFALALERFQSGLHALDADGAEARERRLSDPAIRAAYLHAHYALACLEARNSEGRLGPPGDPPPAVAPADRANRRERAFAHLEELARRRWDGLAGLRTEPDLASLRNDPRFERILSSGR